MKLYKGDSPCLGCGRTGKEKGRSAKDSLCWDCRELLSLGTEVNKLRSLQTDEIVEVNLFMTGLRYLSSGESNLCIAALREFLSSISEKEKRANCKQRHIGFYNSSYSMEIRGIKMTPVSAEHLECFIKALNQYSAAVYADGVKFGSNLLMQLNSGELTPDAFVKRVNGDKSF